jgi:uncharacterized protein
MALELARTPESSRESLARSLRNPLVADDRVRDHVRIVTGPQPYRHAHYSADQFFQTDVAAGTVHNVYGQRALRASNYFLRALIESLDEQTPARKGELLYRIGRAWGERIMAEFAPRIAQEYEVEFEKLGIGMMLESWWWPLRAGGWGTCCFRFDRARSGIVSVQLNGSAAADGVRSETVACDLYAGLFAAAFSRLAHRELTCVELECAAKGGPHCTFVVAAPSRAKNAIACRDEGANVEQILEKIAG